MTELVLAALLGAVGGLLLGWLRWARDLAAASRQREQMAVELGVATARAQSLEQRMQSFDLLQSERNLLAEELAAFKRGSAERERAFTQQAAELEVRFRQLAADALSQSRTDFLQHAAETFERHRQGADAGLERNRLELKALLGPVEETLKRYESGLKAVESARTEAYGGLREQIEAVRLGQTEVRTETAKLVQALRSSPKARGRWGEQQLRNVLELAGLSAHCDFRTEVSVAGDEGRLRPDAVIRLPGGRSLVIDAKCALNAYLDAAEALDETSRRLHLSAHAGAMRAHADALSRKAYWDQFEDAPDFVVMFIPGEHFLSAALDADPTLWDWAFEKRVLMTAPTHLVAIAKTVASVWRQEKVAADARRIAELGRELYQRIATMGDHVRRLGGSLSGAVEQYNRFLGSLETMVLSSARKFEALNVEPGKRTVEIVPPVDAALRPVGACELVIGSDAAGSRPLGMAAEAAE